MGLSFTRDMVGFWLTVDYNYPAMCDIASRSEAVRIWSQRVANMQPYSTLPAPEIEPSNCPPGLSPIQAELVRSITWRACDAAKHSDGRWFPYKDPNEYSSLDLLEKAVALPPQVYTGMDLTAAHRAGLGRIAKNHDLVHLMDECFMIGYRTASAHNDRSSLIPINGAATELPIQFPNQSEWKTSTCLVSLMLTVILAVFFQRCFRQRANDCTPGR